MLWISDEWKEYEVAASGWNGGASSFWCAPTPR